MKIMLNLVHGTERQKKRKLPLDPAGAPPPDPSIGSRYRARHIIVPPPLKSYFYH